MDMCLWDMCDSEANMPSLRIVSVRLRPAHSLGVKGLLSLDNLMEEVGMRLHTYENDLHQICHCYECPVHAEPSENFPTGEQATHLGPMR